MIVLYQDKGIKEFLNRRENHHEGLGGNELANKELKRGLEARHIQMIALGGTIGVGLFMGSASTIKWTGPSVMLAYAFAVFLSSSLCVPWVRCCI